MFDNPRQDFHDLRDRLVTEGRKFDETTIHSLPYDQLHLCCIADAGSAACLPKLVHEEKQRRRLRFLSMDAAELKSCETFLRIEGMYDDVIGMISSRNAPKWEELSDRQKVWAKLNCLFSHPDSPQARLQDVLNLLYRCSIEHSLPADVCRHYMGKLRNLTLAYPGRITDEGFRQKIEKVRDNLREFMLEIERSICTREKISDFQCTSDCFR